MDIKDKFATSSTEHLRSLVCNHEPDEISSNGGEDRSVTKEHPQGLKRKRPNFMHREARMTSSKSCKWKGQSA
jgi:hypothetical protein